MIRPDDDYRRRAPAPAGADRRCIAALVAQEQRDQGTGARERVHRDLNARKVGANHHSITYRGGSPHGGIRALKNERRRSDIAEAGTILRALQMDCGRREARHVPCKCPRRRAARRARLDDHNRRGRGPRERCRLRHVLRLSIVRKPAEDGRQNQEVAKLHRGSVSRLTCFRAGVPIRMMKQRCNLRPGKVNYRMYVASGYQSVRKIAGTFRSSPPLHGMTSSPAPLVSSSFPRAFRNAASAARKISSGLYPHAKMYSV